MTWKIEQEVYFDRVSRRLRFDEAGKVTKSLGLIYEAHLPGASVGSLCEIQDVGGVSGVGNVDAEVVGFQDKRVILMPYEDVTGVHNDSQVVLRSPLSTVPVGDMLLGRVIDARGRPIDDKGPLDLRGSQVEERELYGKPTDLMKRSLISEPLSLGIRSIDTLVTCGKGQRVGIMAGSGVGKSVLLGMIARNTSADINVISLIGERRREVREFIERDLGAEGLARSIIIVETSDSSPILRLRGAFLAATIADYFRDKGKDVLMLMDSVTRFAMAQREIGLAMGEPPASKGYTPSVFSVLPKLLERAGTGATGSVTGLYTVLVEGDDLDDPIGDSARSFLDGHIVLSRKLAERAHFPAVDILKSASRTMNSVVTSDHRRWAAKVREWISVYSEAEDLINIGAYVPGTNPKIDQSIAVHERLNKFLRQEIEDHSNLEMSIQMIQAIFRFGEEFIAERSSSEPESNPLPSPQSQMRI